jgi:hypothetical protein
VSIEIENLQLILLLRTEIELSVLKTDQKRIENIGNTNLLVERNKLIRIQKKARLNRLRKRQ